MPNALQKFAKRNAAETKVNVGQGRLDIAGGKGRGALENLTTTERLMLGLLGGQELIEGRMAINAIAREELLSEEEAASLSEAEINALVGPKGSEQKLEKAPDSSNVIGDQKDARRNNVIKIEDRTINGIRKRRARLIKKEAEIKRKKEISTVEQLTNSVLKSAAGTPLAQSITKNKRLAQESIKTMMLAGILQPDTDPTTPSNLFEKKSDADSGTFGILASDPEHFKRILEKTINKTLGFEEVKQNQSDRKFNADALSSSKDFKIPDDPDEQIEVLLRLLQELANRHHVDSGERKVASDKVKAHTETKTSKNKKAENQK